MKVEFLPENPTATAAPIATIESFGDGVVVDGNRRHEAAAFVNALRPPLTEILQREPNGDELIEACLATGSPRVRKAKA
jgi:hypothetical protein